jgi:hypothetical protein
MFLKKFDLPFFHISLCLYSSSFTFLFEHIVFSKVTRVLSITIPIAPPFQKVCENCHVANVTISPTCNVYCNTCCSKSIVKKLGFLHGSITTNDEHMLLIIKCKWLEAIVHMTEFKFLDLPCLKQVQLFISICIHGKFHLLTTSALVGFQKKSNNLSHKWKLV